MPSIQDLPSYPTYEAASLSPSSLPHTGRQGHDAGPPKYDEIFRQFEVLDSCSDLIELRQIAYDAMAGEVAKPRTVKRLLAEVRALAGSAKKIDDAFERVRVGLGKVDENDYVDRRGTPIPKFQPPWVGFQSRWTTLLWESYDTATATEAYIKDFVEVILPIVEDIKTEDDRIDALRDLKEFIERKDPYGHKLDVKETNNAAIKHSQAYTDLRRDIEAFTTKFDSFAEDQHVKIGERVGQVDLKIDELRREMHRCSTIIWGLGLALGADTGAIGCLLTALGPLSPWVSLGVLAAGLIAAKFGGDILIESLSKYNDLKAQFEACEDESNNLWYQLDYLASLDRTLQMQKADINDIAGRLDRFAVVWKEVAHDAKIISNQLETFVNATEQSERAFKRRVSLIKASYAALGLALAEYATQVDQSGVRKA